MDSKKASGAEGWDDWSDDDEQRVAAAVVAPSPSPPTLPVVVEEERVAHFEGQIKVRLFSVELLDCLPIEVDGGWSRSIMTYKQTHKPKRKRKRAKGLHPRHRGPRRPGKNRRASPGQEI